jgi:DNA invertase Pin-like site-specific DNA recombinase
VQVHAQRSVANVETLSQPARSDHVVMNEIKVGCARVSTLEQDLSAHIYELLDGREYSQTEIAELFGVSRATIYREIQRRVAAAH